MLKYCPKCKQSKKAVLHFGHKRRPNGKMDFASYCHECEGKRPDVRSENAKEAKRRRNIPRNYLITLEEYDQMQIDQDGACAICRQKVKLVVDHDHLTGFVRGLLCQRCNVVLGSVNDDPELLQAMIAYLRNKK